MIVEKRVTSFDDRLGLVAVVAVGAMVASLCWFKLSSLDTGFHLAYGRHFLETGRIVTLDPFLDPSIVLPFINGNWGTQVVMALVDRLGGATGLIVLRWALVAIVFASMAVVVRRTVRGWHWLAWTWLLAALAAYERFALRPELFGYAIMGVMLVILVRGPKSRRDIVVLGVLQVLWTNVTYYFLVGVMLTGSMLGGEVLYQLSIRRNAAQRAARPSRVRWLTAAFVVQCAACLVNPWHVQGAIHPVRTLRFLQNQNVVGLEGDQSAGGTWAMIDEFRQPFRFLGSMTNYRTIDAYLVLLGIAIVGLLILFIRRRWSEGLALALFLVMSVQMRRNIAQFAFVAAPLTAGALALVIPESWTARRAGQWLRRVLTLLFILAAAGWTWSILDGRFYYDERRINREPGIGYSARTNLIDAARWLSSFEAVPSPVFTNLSSSSNLLPWLNRRLQILIDTNTFAYSEPWLGDVMGVCKGWLDYRVFFDRHRVNAVLLCASPETEALVRELRADRDWALVYVDPHALIFLRRMPDLLSIIDSHHPVPEDIYVNAWMETAGGLRHHRAMSIATMGAVPWMLDWYEPAARLFEEALHLAPDSAASWGYLGLCHTKLASAAHHKGASEMVRAHLNNAVHCFERVVSLQPDDPAAQANLSGAREVLQSVR